MQTIAKSLFTLIFLCLWPCLSDNWHCGLYHSVCNSTKITLVQKINDIHDSYLVPFCLLLLTFFQFQGFIYEISIVCLKSVNHWATLLSSYLLISLFGVKFILIHGLFLNRKLVDSGAVQGPIIFFPFFLFFFFFLMYVVLQGVQAELVDLWTKRKTWIEGKLFPVEKGLTL